jgi:shikimate kinase
MSGRNLILLGFMGTGKSSCGRLAATELGFSFLDMDALLEAGAGKPIPRIFAEDGEPAFRRMESELAAELAGREDVVIAAGGGVVLNPENTRRLGERGVLVCLRAEPDTVLRRVAAAEHRPLLEGGDKAERIRSLLAQRKPLYDAIPHQVRTDKLTPAEVARRVLEIYRKATASGS